MQFPGHLYPAMSLWGILLCELHCQMACYCSRKYLYIRSVSLSSSIWQNPGCLPNKLASRPLPSNGSPNLSAAATFSALGILFTSGRGYVLAKMLPNWPLGLQLAASSIPHFNACCPVGRWYGPLTLFFVHKSMKSFTRTQYNFI